MTAAFFDGVQRGFWHVWLAYAGIVLQCSACFDIKPPESLHNQAKVLCLTQGPYYLEDNVPFVPKETTLSQQQCAQHKLERWDML